MEYGYKYSYEKEHCYCPWQRKKMRYDGTWVCRMPSTGKETPFRYPTDKPPTTVKSSHCHGDRKGYIYVPETGKCECKADNKRFIEAGHWVCRFSNSDLRKLLDHERTPSVGSISSKHCISSRLVWHRESMTCRCRKEHLVFGGASLTRADRVFCDLGRTKRERAAMVGLHKYMPFTVQEGVSDKDKLRFALIDHDQGLDSFKTGAQYDAAYIKRRRSSAYLKGDDRLSWLSTEDTPVRPESYGFWAARCVKSRSELQQSDDMTSECKTLGPTHQINGGNTYCSGAFPPQSGDARCCLSAYPNPLNSRGEVVFYDEIFCEPSAWRSNGQSGPVYYVARNDRLPGAEDERYPVDRA